MPIEIEVARFSSVNDENGNTYTVYDTQVEFKGCKWTIKKRYSEFHDFHIGISNLDPHPLPEFPAKHPLGGNDPGVCIQRVLQLDAYMKAVVSIQRFAQSIETTLFLEIYAHVPPETARPKVLVPLPDKEFDPSEVAIPWKLMTLCGFEVHFATEDGKMPKADELLTREEGVVFGQMGASQQAKKYYFEMEKNEKFQKPLTWAGMDVNDYDGLLLGGGHAPGMKQYLESKTLQQAVALYFSLNRPVAAICHGVLLAARSKDPATGESVLYGRKTTTLPKYMENLAYALTFWKYGKLYRTYEEYCADEVVSFLRDSEDYDSGPMLGSGSMFDDRGAHVIQDKLYISGRYPGDAYSLGKKINFTCFTKCTRCTTTSTKY